jgi:hypothetical protein
MESSIRPATKGDLSREAAIGLLASVLAVGAMAIDHLIPGDPIAFLSPRRWRWRSRPFSLPT